MTTDCGSCDPPPGPPVKPPVECNVLLKARCAIIVQQPQNSYATTINVSIFSAQDSRVSARVKYKCAVNSVGRVNLSSSLSVFRPVNTTILTQANRAAPIPHAAVGKNTSASIDMFFGVTSRLTRTKNLEVMLKPLEWLTSARGDTSMRVGLQLRPLVGVVETPVSQFFLPPFGFRFFPGWAHFYVPRYTTLRHAQKLNTCLCARTTITAALTGPGGDLTEIGTKKNPKLRLHAVKRPDSRKSNPRYDLRLVLARETTACLCGGSMYAGIYTATDRSWAVGQSRPVMMLSNFYGNFPAYEEESNFKVVSVKNMMYDIAIQRPAEVIRYVLFYGGCNSSYMLVNAECE